MKYRAYFLLISLVGKWVVTKWILPSIQMKNVENIEDTEVENVLHVILNRLRN